MKVFSMLSKIAVILILLVSTVVAFADVGEHDASSILNDPNFVFHGSLLEHARVNLGDTTKKSRFGDYRTDCFFGDVTTTSGLNKIIYKTRSSFDASQDTWNFYIAGFRIQSIKTLVNAKPNLDIAPRGDRERFEEICGHEMVGTVFSGQQASYEIKVFKFQSSSPETFDHIGTELPVQVETFLNDFNAVIPAFAVKGEPQQMVNVLFGPGMEKYPNDRFEDSAKALRFYTLQYAKFTTLPDDAFDFYLKAPAPVY